MKRFFAAIRCFFLPPANAKTFTRIMPLAVVAFIVILLFAFGNYAWEATNAPAFCGLTCHTMPPEYVTYQQSAHTNVSCEDCHMGRDTLGVLFKRKVTYSWQTGTAMLFNTYEYPIVAKNMAPAREACENCHKPEKFSTDTLVEKKHYADDEANTLTSTFLVVKTGGGTKRQGLGFGIHWHIENPVYFYSSDREQQKIPYVVVEGADGKRTEYVDVDAAFDPASVKQEQLTKMDCITCHNRTAHLIDSPENTVDELMSRDVISAKIPGIKKQAVALLSANYPNESAAMDAIAGLAKTYQTEKAAFYSANTAMVDNAVKALQEAYKNANFTDQKANWQTHPNNLAHKDSPGCFRCHDGKHMTKDNQTVRLECNLCHSVPVVSAPNQLTANLMLEKGFEPESHKNPNWIGLHNQVFNETCKGCHTVEDAGGVSNTSFCSNSVCHGADWKFAGFDAPNLRTVLAAQATELNPPTPTPKAPDESSEPTLEVPAAGPTATPTAAGPVEGAAPAAGPVTYQTLAPVFQSKCGSCHGSAAMKGLNVTTYADLMKGSADGPVIIAGDPANSKIIAIQSAAQPHFGQLSAEELDLLKQWIQAGAAEK